MRTWIRSVANDLLVPPANQVAVLDVLRTLAVTMVIAGHTRTPSLEAGIPTNLFLLSPIVRAGWTGVDLFFLLSGYLIGRQLWQELKRTGSVRVGRFLLRRGFRIWPLYFATFIATLVLVYPGRYSVADSWPDVVFLANYTGPGVVDGGWSLCIEEQFYLFAPLLVMLASSRGWPFSRYRTILIALMLFLPVSRLLSLQLAAWRHGVLSPDQVLHAVYYPFHAHSDGLLAGLFISNLDVDQRLRIDSSWTRWWVLPAGVVACGLCYLVSARLMNYSGLALAFGGVFLFAIPRNASFLPLAKHPLFYCLSRLSFGMYLNHQWFTVPVFNFLRVHGPDAMRHSLLFSLVYFLTLTVLAMAIATCSFACIERPFLILRERWLMASRAKAAVAVPS